MRKYILRILVMLFVFLSTSFANSAEETRITLRSSCMDLTSLQVQSIENIYIRGSIYSEGDVWMGFYGHSTIQHEYEVKSIGNDKVVIDHATGLMWHQSGTKKWMKWKAANKWVQVLNKKGYAGYNDWRLPTVDEAVSLLEPSKKNSWIYIDCVFNNKQIYIWTADTKDGYRGGTWLVGFNRGCVNSYSLFINDINFVRPVRALR
jgi:hypothetical protein